MQITIYLPDNWGGWRYYLRNPSRFFRWGQYPVCVYTQRDSMEADEKVRSAAAERDKWFHEAMALRSEIIDLKRQLREGARK